MYSLDNAIAHDILQKPERVEYVKFLWQSVGQNISCRLVQSFKEKV